MHGSSLLLLLSALAGAAAQTFPLGAQWTLTVHNASTLHWTFCLSYSSQAPPALTATAATFLRALHLNATLYQANGNSIMSLGAAPLAAWGLPTLDSITTPNSSAVLLQGWLQPAGGAAATGPAPWSLTLAAPPMAPSQLAFVAEAALPMSAAAPALQLTLHAADAFLAGAGVQYSALDLRGARVPVYSTEQGVGRGLQPLTAAMDALDPGAGGGPSTTYSQVPTLFSAAGWALALEGPAAYAEVDARTPGALTLLHLAPWLAGRLFGSSGGLLGAAAAHALHTGAGRAAAAALPAWVDEGAIIGLEGGTAAVLAAVQALLPSARNGSLIAAIWMQDWCGAVRYTAGLPREGVWWNWELNSTRYPQWHSQLLPYLARYSISALAYINPYLTPDGPLYAQALAGGHLVAGWRDYGGKGLVNLARAESFEWMVGIITSRLLAPGPTGAAVQGMMSDFGEGFPCLPGQALSACTAAHGQYPLLWARANAEALARAAAADAAAGGRGGGGAGARRQEGRVFFQRAVSTLSPAVTPLFWLGDQLVSWDGFDGLKSAVVGLLCASLAGAGITHSDIGGYTSVSLQGGALVYARSKELFQRWAEFALFTFAMRTHPGSEPSLNWQLGSDAATAAHFFACVAAFKGLAGYRRGLVAQLNATGLPPYAPMAAHFPGAPWSLPVQQQFMMGAELLVAPVTDAGVHSVHVWLPPGTAWRHFARNESFLGRGGWVSISAPIGQPCALWLVGA